MSAEEVLFIFVLFPPFLCSILALSVPIDSNITSRKVSDFISDLLAAFKASQDKPNLEEPPIPAPEKIEPEQEPETHTDSESEIEPETSPSPKMSYQNPTETRNGDETDNDSVENVEPANVLGGRKGQGATDVIPKGEATDLINQAGKKGAQEVEKSKEPSLKIRIKLNLHIKLTLDAQIDGEIEIGLL